MGPQRKLLSRRNFVMNALLYIHTLKRTIFKQKKIQKMIFHFKMAAKLPIFTLRHFDFSENLNKHFPKRIFQ